jgi:DNA primase
MQLDINIINTIEKEGLELRKSGRVYRGCCPFHEDKTPSFAVYEDSNRFVCFGCGEKGDAIDFIMKLRNFSFKEALSYLKIDSRCKDFRKDANTINKQHLIKAFRQWENEYYDELSNLYRIFNKLLMTIKTIKGMEKYDFFYHQVSIWEYHMDILLFGDDQEKFELFEGINL